MQVIFFNKAIFAHNPIYSLKAKNDIQKVESY